MNIEEQNQAYLITLLKSLMANDRLTSETPILLDSIEINSIDNQAPQQVYDDNGLSNHVTEHGGVRVIEVDELINEWLKSGNEDKHTVAQKQSEYYCFLSPNRVYTEDQRNQIFANQERNWRVAQTQGSYVDTFYLMKARYVNKVTGQKLFRSLTSQEYFSKQFVRQNHRLVDTIPNHSTLSFGNFSNPDHPEWQKRFREQIVHWVKVKMEQDLKHLHDVNPYGPK